MTIKIPLLKEPLSVPLCVDLDGTLIHEDTTKTAFYLYCGKNPLRYCQVAYWYSRWGLARMKRELGKRVSLDNHPWTFSQSVLTMIQQEKKAGRKIYLVSATDMTFAKSVAMQSPCYDHFHHGNIMASEGKINYRSVEKSKLLCKVFGAENYVYIGNSTDDISVWKTGLTPVIVQYNDDDDYLANAMKRTNKSPIVLQEYTK